MHPIFAGAGEQAVPILFVTADTFEKNRCGSWGYCALRKRYLGYFAA